MDLNGQLWWYTARAGGIVAWALVAMSITWGLALSTKAFGKRPRPAWVLDLHRYLGGLALVFTGVHVASIMIDGFVHFGLTDVFVPFASSWNPSGVAWGIVTMYLLVAVELTSLARKYLPKKLWRQTHYLSFPLFVMATVHGITAGTDASGPALFVALAAGLAPVIGLVAVRIDQAGAGRPGTGSRGAGSRGTGGAVVRQPPAATQPIPSFVIHDEWQSPTRSTA